MSWVLQMKGVGKGEAPADGVARSLEFSPEGPKKEKKSKKSAESASPEDEVRPRGGSSPHMMQKPMAMTRMRKNP